MKNNTVEFGVQFHPLIALGSKTHTVRTSNKDGYIFYIGRLKYVLRIDTVLTAASFLYSIETNLYIPEMYGFTNNNEFFLYELHYFISKNLSPMDMVYIHRIEPFTDGVK